jgi:hypothetical protein
MGCGNKLFVPLPTACGKNYEEKKERKKGKKKGKEKRNLKEKGKN